MPNPTKAFLAMPFREDYRWIHNAIAAACREIGIDLIRVDEQTVPGSNIITGMHQFIHESTFAFVVISGLNPNVLYELGLLHSLSKPTVILADRGTVETLPFDLKSMMVVRYDADAKNETDLKLVSIAAASRVLKILTDSTVRSEIAQGLPSSFVPPKSTTAELSVGEIDWDAIVRSVEKSMGLKGCQRKNLIQFDDATTSGWKLKARCQGGATAEVVIDLNGDIKEIDVQ